MCSQRQLGGALPEPDEDPKRIPRFASDRPGRHSASPTYRPRRLPPTLTPRRHGVLVTPLL
jgi:hypothetical protein